MKVRLIQPSQLDEDGNVVKYEKLFFPSITLPTLAGLTPPGVDISITNDYVEDINYDDPADLVGITAFTCQAPRAYQIAGEFRKRGQKVVMGGIHVSVCPDEASEHCDAVVVGEAEDIWATVLNDARSGSLQRRYKASTRPDISAAPAPRFDLIDYRQYVIPPFARTPLITIQTTRGCPHDCDFCSVVGLLGHEIRKKSVSQVIKEIESAEPSRVFFADDNIGADPEYARELFKALRPLKIRWACQMSTRISKHPDLIELAGSAGCHETLIGIETVNEETLRKMNKSFNKVSEYGHLFRQLKDAGILAQAQVIFGMDGDTVSSMEKSVEQLLQWDVNYVYITILTPFPGTRVYDRMLKEDRLTTRDWSEYDATHVVFKPSGVSAAELEETLWRMYRKVYSTGSIAGRLWRFKGEYVKCFPRDNAFEELFLQFYMRSAVMRKRHPLSLGSSERVASARQ